MRAGTMILLLLGCGCGDGVVVAGSTGFCGNGVVDEGEGCDDRNEVETDACTNDCVVAACGDGIVRAGEEACDDGNDSDTDGCTNLCRVAGCGDGVLRTDLNPGDDSYEACDDGDDRNDNGCTNACAIARCGDGLVRTGVEACDDGNDIDTDACLRDCSPARCGDGILRTDLAEGDRGFEACDDGNDNNDDDCTSDCQGQPLGSSPERAALDCRAILDRHPNAENGSYWINPTGDGEPFTVDCDMDGGWVVMQLDDSDGVVVAEYAESNPWHKCGDDAGAPFGTTQDQLAADSSPSGSHSHELPLTYAQPSSGVPFTPAEIAALRGRMSELHTDSRMVALTADDDSGDLHGGAPYGHEVYIRDAEGEWVLLTPGTNGECGGGLGSWPTAGSESAIYFWHTTAEGSSPSGNTRINADQMGALQQKDLLPDRVRIEVRTGGGGAFGYEQRQFRVR